MSGLGVKRKIMFDTTQKDYKKNKKIKFTGRKGIVSDTDDSDSHDEDQEQSQSDYSDNESIHSEITQWNYEKRT